MQNPTNLLVIVNPAMQRSPAWEHAIALARKTQAALHLCLVDYKPAIAGLRHIDSSVMRMAIDNYMGIRLRWLESEVKALARDGIRADCRAVWGKAACEILVTAILDTKPDLVIKDIEETGRVRRAIFTPLDWQLLRMCPAPLMLVRPQSASDPQRIIATVDPMEDGARSNELNDHILQTAQALAGRCRAEWHAVYAYPHLEIPDEPVAGARVSAYDRMHREVHEAHQKAFERLMDRHAVPAERRHFLEGKEVESAIGDFANKTATDLVVLGTVYRGTMDRLVLGSTAERLLYRLDCNVLALKPAGFDNQLPQILEKRDVDATAYTPAGS